MNISKDIKTNLDRIKIAMSIPLSTDAILREFAIVFKDKKYKAFLIYYEGMVTNERIDNFIVKKVYRYGKTLVTVYQKDVADNE